MKLQDSALASRQNKRKDEKNMSEKKNGSSPFTDKEYLQSSSSRNNKNKKDVTAEEIDEFGRVFSDSEPQRKGTDGKGFFSSFKQGKTAPSVIKEEKESATRPVIIPAETNMSSEDLYAEQDFDIDAFIASLGGKPAQKKEDKESSASKDGTQEHTKHFSVTKAPEITKASQRTRHFNLSDAVKDKIHKSVPAARENEDIKGGVRVLSEDKPEDQAILEVAPTGEGSESPLDSVTAEKGEDIFTAVDKAVRIKKQGFADTGAESAKKKAKKKKEEETLLTGKALRASLSKKVKKQRIQLLLALVLFFVTLIISCLPNFYSVGNPLEYMFADGGKIYTVINIAVLFLLVLIFIKDYISAIESIINLKPDGNTSLFLVTLFVLFQALSSLTLHTSGLNGVRLYTIFAVFAAGVKCMGDYFKTRTALRSLVTIMKSQSLRSVQSVENKADAKALAQGVNDESEPRILYCAEVDAGDNLTAGVGARQDESRYYTYSSIAVLLIGFVMGIVMYVKNRDGAMFMTTLLSSICMCTPVMSDTIRAINVYMENLNLNKFGAAATEYEGIRCVGEANGVTMDISDIFTAEVSRFRPVPGAVMDKNEAAVFASAVTIGANSLTGKCFEDFMQQLGATLPEAETVQYEEGLGYTAWVKDKRVLVGNREMLVQHSIYAPDEKEEKRYAKNKFVMYLAVEGQLVASFLVNYKVLSAIRKLSLDFNTTGLVLMLTSKEPCLTQKEIAKRLSLDTAAVKVLSTKCCEIINEYRQNRTKHITSGLVCSEKSRTLLPLVVRIHNLFVSDKLLYNIHILGQSAGFLLLALSFLLNMTLLRSPFMLVLLHVLWSAGAYFLLVRKKSDNI